MKPQKSERTSFTERPFFLLNEDIRQRAIAAIYHAPIDPLRPLQVVIREAPKKRKLDQNALFWAGPLRDISEQAWLDGRQFSAEVWATFFKRLLLPEENDPALCLESYKKWDIDPAGERVLIGSTTQLTVAGFAQYIEAVTAFGAEVGVMFHIKD
jgi:hypothetical protein